RGKVVERPAVAQAEERFPLHGLDDRRTRQRERLEHLLAEDERLAVHRRADVVELGVHREGDVRRQRPGGRRPDQEAFARPSFDRQLRVDRGVGHLAVAVAHRHLVLRQRGAAAGAPRHRAMALVQPAALLADLQDVPDVRDVVVGVRVVRVVPVHPLTEADGLLRDRLSGAIDARAARVGEPADAVRLDVPLAVQVQLALDLHLDPEALAVEAVLVALVLAEHGVVALIDVLVRARPPVVDAHGLDVGRDRAVIEGIVRVSGVLLPQHVEAALALPQLEHAMLELGQVDARPDRREFRLLGDHDPSRYRTTVPQWDGRSDRGTTQLRRAPCAVGAPRSIPPLTVRLRPRLVAPYRWGVLAKARGRWPLGACASILWRQGSGAGAYRGRARTADQALRRARKPNAASMATPTRIAALARLSGAARAPFFQRMPAAMPPLPTEVA